jgi:hypothetical protein
MDPKGLETKRLAEDLLRRPLEKDTLLERFLAAERRSIRGGLIIAFLAGGMVLSILGILMHQVWTLQNELWVLRTQCVPLPLDYDHEHP